MTRQLPLRPTLLAWIAATLIVTLGSITALMYLRTEASIEQLVRQQLAAATKAARSEVSSMVSTANGILNELATLAIQGQLPLHDRQRLAPLLVERVRQQPVIGWLGFGNLLDDAYVAGNRAFENGSIRVYFAAPAVDGALPSMALVSADGSTQPLLIDNPTPYRVSTRPWVQAALQAPGVAWNDPLVFTDGMLGVAAVIRVQLPKSAPPIDGVFHADFFLRDLHQFLRSIEVGDTGRVFVIAGNRTLIGVDDSERTFFEDATGLRGTGRDRLNLNDVVYRAAWSPLDVKGGPDWTIGILVPEDELTGIVAENARVTLLAGLFALVMALLLAAWLSKLISSPIHQMSLDVAQISNFNLSTNPPPTSWIREVAVLGDAIDHMKIGLRSFEKFVPSEVVRKLIAARKEAVLGVEPAELTILFSDIKGFTTITESLAPDRLVEVVGEYLDEMSKIVIASDATLDKYIGDAIMAFWNAPTTVANHPVVACTAALASQRRLGELRAAWAERGLPPLRARIGLHTGSVLVGNLGSVRRLSYTAIGDAVNLAARLESLNDRYGTFVLISEAMRQAIGDEFVCRPLDLVAVKGKSQGIRVYELLASRAEASDQQREDCALHGAALDHYLQRDFATAGNLFERYLQRHPADTAAGLLRDRCARLEQDPPAPDWNGVFVMQGK